MVMMIESIIHTLILTTIDNRQISISNQIHIHTLPMKFSCENSFLDQSLDYYQLKHN